MADDTRIRIRSASEAVRELPDHEGGVVSIGAPGTSMPPGVDPARPDHLRLEFDDVERASERGPSMEDAEIIVDAAPTLLGTGDVYCHCQAGVSRSSATALGLWCFHLGEGREAEAAERILDARPIARPNRRLAEMIGATLGRKAALRRAARMVRNDMAER